MFKIKFTRCLSVLCMFILCRQALMSQNDLRAGVLPDSTRLIAHLDYDPRPALPGMPRLKSGGRSFFERRGSKFVLPALFIAYGTAARFNQLPFRRLDHAIDREIDRRIKRKYRIDDFLQYGMPVAAYGLDFIPGIEARHNLRDRTLIMATSLIVMQSAVSILKSTTAVARPGDGRHNSFPSGHTACAMLSAHILYKEYKDVTPWIGIGGYLMATATGVFRMLNDAHWLSDVVAGAGIGLLSAEIGYMMLSVRQSVLKHSDGGRQIAVMPVIGLRQWGVGMACRF